MTFKPVLQYCLFLVTISFALVVKAQTPFQYSFVIDENSEFPIDVGSSMEYLEDETRSFTLQEVSNDEQEWQAIETASPNFGFTASRIWFRFQINNDLREAKPLYVELPVPFLDNIQLFHVHSGLLETRHHVGDQKTFDERPIRHENYVMPLSVQPGNNQIYLSVSSNGTVEAPLYIWSPDVFSSKNAQKELVQGLWIGIIIVMIIYNFFIYFFIRDKNYLYYIFFAGNYLMTEITIRGYGFAYFWSDFTYWNNLAIPVFMSSTSFSLAILANTYLNLKQHSQWAFRTMRIMAILSMALLITSFIAPYAVTIRLAFLLSSSVCLTSCLAGYLMWYRGMGEARFYCIAWTSAFAGIAVLLAVKFGLLPENIWTSQATQIGIILLIIFLSIAMGNRFNQEKELRLAAQGLALNAERQARLSEQALLAAKQSANENLEREVEVRTKTLKRALDELEKANDRLEVLSTTDSLTGLYNRGYFEAQLESEFSRAKRHERDLAVVLCDIDHFKAINDNYGHKAGDECLKSFSRILQKKITRTGDIVARYGGEEFIILLPDTTREQAVVIADWLCNALQNKAFHFRKQDIKVTASFGVASMNQSHTTSAETLVTNADIALYKAKDQGRNQVAV